MFPEEHGTIHSPEELQSTDLYVKKKIFISWHSELDVRWLVRIPKSDFSRFVKTAGYHGNGLRIPIFRSTKLVCKYKGFDRMVNITSLKLNIRTFEEVRSSAGHKHGSLNKA